MNDKNQEYIYRGDDAGDNDVINDHKIAATTVIAATTATTDLSNATTDHTSTTTVKNKIILPLLVLLQVARCF